MGPQNVSRLLYWPLKPVIWNRAGCGALWSLHWETWGPHVAEQRWKGCFYKQAQSRDHGEPPAIDPLISEVQAHPHVLRTC